MSPGAGAVTARFWVTVAAWLLALFAGFGSGVSAKARAWLVKVPGPPGVTVMAKVAWPPLANEPTVKSTTPPALWVKLPWLAVAETKVAPAGSVSISDTLAAWLGPLFVTVTV